MKIPVSSPIPISFVYPQHTKWDLKKYLDKNPTTKCVGFREVQQNECYLGGSTLEEYPCLFSSSVSGGFRTWRYGTHKPLGPRFVVDRPEYAF